ncbi:hypothetical protein ADK60_13720 [Streptomyces sp. XY431]|uniref:hypothetical protein n=1 Tax=Streptomyces sp. XY431 TaxID=1415562 RepID=UPI0006ADD28C|nr:hypothetical protein [Streptomyces sp. XY431]KOV32495.1 hypothetical protein ADK60_13720 [Streptomyces sp. XY431]
MRKFSTALALTMAALLTAAPAAAAAVPAAEPAQHRTKRQVLFDFWFNQHADSPAFGLVGGVGERSIFLNGSCDSDVIAAQLYHETNGFDRPVGNAFTIPCNEEATLVHYDLSGGTYYFYLLSGVDNTHVRARVT